MRASGLKGVYPEFIRQYRTSRIILRVDIPDSPSEHSIAGVHYKKHESDTPRCDLYLYEDGLWKEYVAVQNPDRIEEECKKMGIILKGRKLVDDSEFIQNLMP